MGKPLVIDWLSALETAPLTKVHSPCPSTIITGYAQHKLCRIHIYDHKKDHGKFPHSNERNIPVLAAEAFDSNHCFSLLLNEALPQTEMSHCQVILNLLKVHALNTKEAYMHMLSMNYEINSIKHIKLVVVSVLK
jgi:hypothetical protein